MGAHTLDCPKVNEALIGSLVGWIVTHLGFLLLGITGIFEHVLNLISWWAITLTAWDIPAATDVKVDTA